MKTWYLLIVITAAIAAACTATQRTVAEDLARKACVVIDNIPTGSQMFIMVDNRDGGTAQ